MNKRRRIYHYATGGQAGPTDPPVNPLDREVLDWNVAYINSPKYRERLSNFYKYPEVVQRVRGERIANVKFNPTTEGTRAMSYYGNGNDITIGPLGVKNIVLNSPKGANPSLLRQEITAHELGHGTNAATRERSDSPTAGTALSDREQRYILDRNQKITPARRTEVYRQMQDPKSPDRFSGDILDDVEHDLAPTESMSDVNALRFLLNKKKVYDAGTQDFNAEHLNKARQDKDLQKSFIFKRLQENFQDKDLIDILNKVAVNTTTTNETMAAYGGSINKKRIYQYANGGTFMTNGNFSTAANAGAGIIDGLDQGTPYGRKRIGTTVASGALSGAALGASVGGPWGAVIGGVVGAGVGLFKGKSDKRKEDRMIAAQNMQRENRMRQASAAAIAADPGLVGGYGNRGYYARGGSLRNALPGYSGDQELLSDYIMDTNPWMMDGALQSDALDGRLQLNNGGRIVDHLRKKKTAGVPPEMAAQYGFPAQVPVQVNAEGGTIHIKPENRGKFTASASRAGMGVQEFASHVLANKEDYSSTQVKRANFARNASKWHAHGGVLSYMGKARGGR